MAHCVLSCRRSQPGWPPGAGRVLQRSSPSWGQQRRRPWPVALSHLRPTRCLTGNHTSLGISVQRVKCLVQHHQGTDEHEAWGGEVTCPGSWRSQDVNLRLVRCALFPQHFSVIRYTSYNRIPWVLIKMQLPRFPASPSPTGKLLPKR